MGESGAAMDFFDAMLKPMKEFSKNLYRLVNKCRKPDAREYQMIGMRVSASSSSSSSSPLRASLWDSSPGRSSHFGALGAAPEARSSIHAHNRNWGRPRGTPPGGPVDYYTRKSLH